MKKIISFSESTPKKLVIYIILCPIMRIGLKVSVVLAVVEEVANKVW